MLVSNVGGMAAMLVHDETARLVPPGDSDALAAELRWFMSHRERAVELGRAARQLVGRQYSVERMIAATLELYEAPSPAHSSRPSPPGRVDSGDQRPPP